MDLFLGVDGGGSKTLACVADVRGHVLGVGRASGSNFQVVGEDGAAYAVQLASQRALAAAAVRSAQVVAACYGLCGADREKDFAVCRRWLAAVSPVRDFELTNDTTIALRAGTTDGVGIGLVAGTGANQIGVNRRGVLEKVGGLARVLGDSGGALDIGEQAVAAAMRGHDGRGEPTVLHERIVAFLELDALEDLIEAYFVGAHRVFDPARLAPLVFEAAHQGDAVARRLVAAAGAEAACCANVLLRRLFAPDERVPIVLGGSLWQRARNEVMFDALRAGLDPSYPFVELCRLDVEPVLGGVLYALDARAGGRASPEVRARLAETYRHPPSEDA
ncbi:MAG: BadF/BadG/BcrA/BcrD ATPase family protein [bacterium]